MDERAIVEYGKEFLRENFNIDLHIPIIRNNRLRSSYGRYVMDNRRQPLRIEIAGRTLDSGREDVIMGIIKHECIHYALHIQGKDLRDGQPIFEKTLEQYGAPSTKTMKIGLFFLCLCKTCNQTFETNRKQIVKTPQKYRTKCCNGHIAIIEKRIYDGYHFSKI